VSTDQRVLVVDSSGETHEVLQAALARSGVRTYGARRTRRGLALAEEIRPDLIVLDLEVDEAEAEATCFPFAEQSRRNATPLVVLGSVRRVEGGSPLGEFVPKPYDYGPLVRKIEELLARNDECRRRAA